ncbi:hypothetical protein [Saccharothrix yanglingensis]|uniref:ADP ribosyltransferase domain-containing protein n=1 Tax=Saccharothrix yanglingensis TaxID=659496 RepID=A0ABU0XBZ9_9PSEU|nr:hypothetical protein [Saccharothrix yanglingensis]MDQ2588764.1 hypothetical protein [Saccharothrix yanglingensis]
MSPMTERRGGVEMTSRMIGNALVVHPRDQLTPEARNLALVVAVDPHHDLVVVDLPTGSPFSAWESVADLMPRPRRGVRIVIGGRSRETTALAGQWLAERLNRPVIAPDGAILPGVGGSLFVDAGRHSGWIRFQPGKPPRWESKRFPKPTWESEALSDPVATSATGIAEPLGGGVWIRPACDDGQLRVHRARLQENLPCQPDVLTLVLGCPDAPSISFDDVARFWAGLPAQLKGRTRLLRYGQLSDSDGGSSAQALTNFIGEELVWYTGLPVGAVVDPDVYTIRAGGAPGWRSAVRELAYTPQPAGITPPPRLVSHRPPVHGVSEVGPAVYWYAPDAVVEVVPAGMWVRPPEEPEHADSVRSTPVDPERHLMLFDAPDEATGARMKVLADDLVARLDPTTRWMSDVVPAAARARVRPDVRPTGRAMAGIDGEPDREAVSVPSVPAPSDGTSPDGARPGAPVVEAATELVARPVPTPVVDLARAGDALDAETRRQPDTGRRPAADRSAPVDAPVLPPSLRTESSFPTAPPAATAPTPPTGPPPTTPPPPTAPPEEPGALPAPTARPAAASAAPPVTAAPVTAPPAAVPPAAAPPPGRSAPAVPPVGAAPVGAPPLSGGVDVPPPDASTPPPPEQVPAEATGPTGDTRPGPATRVQPVPAAAAAAVMPKRGLDDERTWLRKTLNQQFSSVANSVARVLSEHPSFQGSTGRSSDLLTDAVAVRLYLSPEGDGVDDALRTAVVGPHVPFARCAVSGLSRLPSHRGIAVFTTSMTEQDWELYRGRKLVTEWGFLNALSAPCARQEGDVDVLVWSMTGRRTRLLEPEVGGMTDRVLFVPGTSFKVLGLTEPAEGARGRVLLRELAAGEIDATGRVDRNRVSLDELAKVALRGSADKWASAPRDPRTPAYAVPRFHTLPGLVRRARAERSQA